MDRPILFICDDAPPFDASKSATALLMQEAQQRGYTVLIAPPEAISRLDDGAILHAHTVNGSGPSDEQSQYALSELHSIHIRQDPPFDMRYITLTYMLDDVPVPCFNPPAAIRNGAEKFLPFLWPEFCPPTLITQSADAVHAFLQAHGEMVLKPLYGFHSYGVMHFKQGDRNIDSYLEYYFLTHKDPLIVQAFLPSVREGNKRLVFLGGEYVGGYVTKPEADGVRIYRDTIDEVLELSDSDRRIVQALSPWLKEQGLYFVGIDVIGDKLIEVNTTSTGSLHRMNALYGKPFEQDYWNGVDARCR